jgi:hypothetical protein
MEDILTEEEINRYVDEETHKLIKWFIQKAYNMICSYMNGAVHLFTQRFKVPLDVETKTIRDVDGFEIAFRVYFSPDTIAKMRDIIYRNVKENRLNVRTRTVILKSIIKREFKTNTGGVNALLHDIHPSSTEGVDEIGRVRKKVWREEGRSTDESVDEGDIRGDKVEGDEK